MRVFRRRFVNRIPRGPLGKELARGRPIIQQQTASQRSVFKHKLLHSEGKGPLACAVTGSEY